MGEPYRVALAVVPLHHDPLVPFLHLHANVPSWPGSLDDHARTRATLEALVAALAPIARPIGANHGQAILLAPCLADVLDTRERAAFAAAFLDEARPLVASIAAQMLITWSEAPARLFEPRYWWNGATNGAVAANAAIGHDVASDIPLADLASRVAERRIGRRAVIERLLTMPHRWLDPEQVELIELRLDDPAWVMAMLVAGRTPVSIGVASDTGRALRATLDELAGFGLVRVADAAHGAILVSRGKLLRRPRPRADLALAYGGG